MLNYLTFALLFAFAWITSFLLHELMHIKGQGITMSGYIKIIRFSMMALPENNTNTKWFYYSGGLLSALIFYLFTLLIYPHTIPEVYLPFLFMAIIQTAAGLMEGYNYMFYSHHRFKVYAVMLAGMVVIWSVI